MPCNNPCTLFFGPLHLHLLVWSELGWFGIFDQREILKCNGHMPSVSCPKWPLIRWNFSNENMYDANSNKPWNIIHNLPCNNPYRLFFRPLSLLLLVWSILGWFGLSDQWEILKCNGHGPSVLCMKRPLEGNLLVWSELKWFGLFDQWETLKCNGHMPSVLCTNWPFIRWNFSNKNRYDANSNKPWNIVHNLPCNNPYRLFFGPLGLLPFWCEVNLDGSAFPTNERSSNATVTGLQSCVWSDP